MSAIPAVVSEVLARINQVNVSNKARSDMIREQSVAAFTQVRSDKTADSIAEGLTNGGKEKFGTPAEYQSFKSSMRSAMSDMTVGGYVSNNDKSIEGMNTMLGALNFVANPQSTARAAALTLGASDSEKKAKMLELVQKLLSMGVPPEKTSEVMELTGMSKVQSQQVLDDANASVKGDLSQSQIDSAKQVTEYMKTNLQPVGLRQLV